MQTPVEERAVKAEAQRGATYSGSEMSDGERLALYMIGQSLCAPENAIVIIDEPEVHLHKSILAALWDEVEKVRSDCVFVYLTHDIEFASTRTGARKLSLEEFDGTHWTWKEVEECYGLPEDLVLKLLGSRLPILFVEGEEGSLDLAIYRAVYPGWLIVPMGSCTKVIDATKALGEVPEFHRLSVCGLIDRDFRAEAEIEALKSHHVFVLPVAEIENVLCAEQVVKLVAEHMGKDPDDVFSSVREFVIKEFEAELENQTALLTSEEVRHRLAGFEPEGRTLKGLKSAFAKLVDNVDVEAIYRELYARYKSAAERADYPAVLQHYKRKSVARRLAPYFGLNEGEYEPLISRLARNALGGELLRALRQCLPELPSGG